MKVCKKISKIFLLAFTLIVLLANNSFAEENNVNSIDMTVTIHNDGSATIKSILDLDQYTGTEFYIPMGDMMDSEIIDFKVYENDKQFEDLGRNWDINKSIDEKKGKSGIYNENNEDQLVLGIGEYGNHVFTLEYKISNFVKETTDQELVTFWKYVNSNFNMGIDKFNLKIISDAYFPKEELRVWGFGYKGETKIEDGYVTAFSTDKLTKSNYVTILYKLPKESINTNSKIDKSLEEIINQAKVGSDFEKRESSSSKFFKFPFLFFAPAIMGMLVQFSIIILIIVIIRSKSGKGRASKKAKALIKSNKDQYYREIPSNHSGITLYNMLCKLGYGSFENLLTGYFLKWIKEGVLEVIEVEEGLVFKKDKKAFKINSGVFKENKDGEEDETLELKLLNYIKQAAEDNVLSEREFSKWAGRNRGKLDKFRNDVDETSKNKLLELGYYDSYFKKGIFKEKEVFEENQNGEKLMTNIIGFKNYLSEFSLLEEKESIHVNIWEEYMIWAGFLGIAKQVIKEFNKLYPEYRNEGLTTLDTIYFVNSMSHSAYNSAFGTSSSSGFGGGSSISGGGGSFGGGSGGGAR